MVTDSNVNKYYEGYTLILLGLSGDIYVPPVGPVY